MQGACRQGSMWRDLDINYGLLVLLFWLGIVQDLRPVPQNVLTSK